MREKELVAQNYIARKMQTRNHRTFIFWLKSYPTPLYHIEQYIKNCHNKASLVVQWLRICLPMQRSRKIPHAAGQLNPSTTATEPESPCSTTLQVTTMKCPRLQPESSPCLPHLKKALAHSSEGLAQPKIK